MNKMKWMALAALVAALTACASRPQAPQTSWNQGVWNSVLGYNGPANSMAMAAGPQ